MIHGIGTDIVLEKRIAALYKKHGRAFAERVLHPAELPEFEAAARPAALLAKRFAAKEAAAKAIGTGIRGAVSFRNIGIGHNAKGKPETLFAPPLQAFLDELGIARVHISISDDSGTVTAFAVAEK
ncbi:TPA: holo-ACP synthase [Neisseria bacilliformis]|uniref:holo-ACP synthase n=1 Tax=Neisseria bacilliformis TaxID=267212 RepID=UPI0006666431|nr:holo-ACP synthase [Neisseria bacilliformis]